VEERIRALLLQKVKGGEGNRREENETNGKKRDLPDQCQTASYAPEECTVRSEKKSVARTFAFRDLLSVSSSGKLGWIT